MDETTEDRVLDGRVRLRQPERGYRAGLDAALLAAACDAGEGARVIEAGCGAGGALLAAAARRAGARFVGIERDPKAAALAQQNIALNGMADRVEVREGDVALRFSGLGLEPFDAAMANPPFFDDPDSLRGPAAERRGAWMADDGLEAWIGFLTKAVREGGTITLIHRADRLDDILALLAAKAGSVQIRPVQPFADEPAKRVVVRAVKTGKAPLRLLPALVLHDREGGKHTAETEAILRGQAALAWLSLVRPA
ncbi:methyltransferase domain-containing protein [Phenylobacterium sp.]|jgi:tRNA1(Val) A37 N6-methylase TrmN6|uniref:tRNA1(Val) (adenine(37)-N6)-methyltransferase n=1 Tax=Phenylobacterium sp. TaxID=1871053 RepID=UPI00120501C6|nr:methyltransferase domain-containing protein [Phenylobacterium sp.]THD70286.1 MAG: methyltransferase domain-containing protein [Phenylobacterium sp.]